MIDNYKCFELRPMDRNVAMAIKKEEGIYDGLVKSQHHPSTGSG